MNGVDVADQLRASYNTHFKGVRNWLPLFYWLVDTLKVNAFILRRMHYPKDSHVNFQLKLSEQLISQGLGEHRRQQLKRKVVSKPNDPLPGLPPPQIDADGSVNNVIHCLDYINRKKVQLRQCIVCKKRTCFCCVFCQNAFCKRSACVSIYPCSYTKAS